MLRQFFIKAFCILFIVTLWGCANTPKSRFAKLYDEYDHTQNIDLVIDVLVRSDIKGGEVGVDPEKQKQLLNIIEGELKSAFESRQMTLTKRYSGFGLMYKPVESAPHVFATGKESTGENFNAPVGEPFDSAWRSPESVAFLEKAMAYAPHASYKKEEVKKAAPATKGKKKVRRRATGTIPPALTKENFPVHLNGSTSRYVLFAQANLTEVGAFKTAGSAVATALLSAALTGGMYIYSSAPVTGCEIHLVMIDTRDHKIVWHNTLRGRGLKQANQTVKAAISPFPGGAKVVKTETTTTAASL